MSIQPRTKEEMDSIFSDCYRFLFEYYLSKKDGISREYQEVIGFPDECLDAFSDQARIQLKYAQGKMMVGIMKGLLSSDAILTLQNVGKFKFDTEEKISGWEKRLSESEEKAKGLQARLDKQETAFNFVGLYDGFNQLARDKQGELKHSGWWMIGLGAVIVLVVSCKLVALLYMK